MTAIFGPSFLEFSWTLPQFLLTTFSIGRIISGCTISISRCLMRTIGGFRMLYLTIFTPILFMIWKFRCLNRSWCGYRGRNRLWNDMFRGSILRWFIWHSFIKLSLGGNFRILKSGEWISIFFPELSGTLHLIRSI